MIHMEMKMNNVTNNLLTKRDEKIVKLELLRKFVRNFRNEQSSIDKSHHANKKI